MKGRKPIPVKVVSQPFIKRLPRPSMKRGIASLFFEVIFMTTGIFVGVEGFIAQFSNRDLQTAVVYYAIGFLLIILSKFSYNIKYSRR